MRAGRKSKGEFHKDKGFSCFDRGSVEEGMDARELKGVEKR